MLQVLPLGPQLHVPFKQRSATRLSQGPHVPAGGPQAPRVGLLSQLLPLQQPPGQLAPLQTHAPPMQSVPAPQGGALVPQVQPPSKQLLVEPEQMLQALPPPPHAPADSCDSGTH